MFDFPLQFVYVISYLRAKTFAWIVHFFQNYKCNNTNQDHFGKYFTVVINS